VNIALPSTRVPFAVCHVVLTNPLPTVDIAVDMGLDTTMITWVIAAYSISFGALMLCSGRMGDMFGYRNMFIFGLTFFAVWSIVCGSTTQSNLFVVARALQGMGAAATIPNGLALITANYEGKARERAIGVFGGSASLGFTVGLIVGNIYLISRLSNDRPLIGSRNQGGLFTYNVGYQWIFYFSAIVAGTQALLAFIIIPDDRDQNKAIQEAARQKAGTNEDKPWYKKFDFVGAVLITAAIFFLVFFLTEGT